jgi:uncharacterized membrane protein HdeD (DUF308 family)
MRGPAATRTRIVTPLTRPGDTTWRVSRWRVDRILVETSRVTAAGATPGAGPEAAPTVGKYWWIPLVMGVLSVIIGFVALAYPGPTLLAVGLLFGGYLTLWGTMTIVHGATDPAAPTFARILLVIVGILGVVVGLMLIVRPGQSVVTAALVLGFWFTVSGIVQFVRGIAEEEGRVWNLIWGVIGLIAGTIILGSPEIGVVTLVYVVGFGLIFQGFMETAAGFAARRLHKEGVL